MATPPKSIIAQFFRNTKNNFAGIIQSFTVGTVALWNTNDTLNSELDFSNLLTDFQSAAGPNPVNTVDLGWQIGFDDLDNIYVYRSTDNKNFSLVISLPGTDDDYTDSGLTTGTTYYYRIRAKRGNLIGDFLYTNQTTA